MSLNDFFITLNKHHSLLMDNDFVIALRQKTEELRAVKQKSTAEINDALPSPPSRLVYLVTLNNFTGITKDFVEWILTDGQQYVFENGYGAIPSDILDDQMRILQGE